MKHLWAPWRMEYIQGDGSPEAGCIFCVRDLAGEDEKRLILARGEHAFVIMNKFPYTNGHLMVAPYRHTAELGELSEAEILEMHRMLAFSQRALTQCMAPQGFNIGLNLGRTAGAGIEDHLHMHLVPRWNGDTNFMPVFADVRVIPQHLEATYRHLSRCFSSWGT
ncbi:HIT family hydrolase [Desulfuromonas versatilis]|uniref:HIT family hydrolase n=1 Tax=Desulfuromonas versatilis TaxID=2802975 RepID=A0ABN6DXN3_9BACT|nr:HIT domain-containing protein [Desulfuromonas versatilis]BCR04800.1 HIT family hydrolase [Desulfuromonas versatilis]